MKISYFKVSNRPLFMLSRTLNFRLFGLIFLFIGFQEVRAQTTYQKIINRIDSLSQLGLPKSALLEVDKLNEWSKLHKNPSGQIKATIYRMNLISYLGNDSFGEIIHKIKDDISRASYPVKPVLESILADIFFKYYQENRYQISQRTRLLKPDSDFKNWDIQTLLQESSRLYQLSLENEIQEQNTTTEILEGNLEGDPNTRYLRPSLYDILVHRALDFYLSEESEITRPVQPFDLNNPKFFGDAQTFVALRILTKDSLSSNYLGLVFLQKALKFHLNKPTEEAVADLDLKRIEFVYKHSRLVEKDSLYRLYLNQLESKFRGKSISAEILWTLGKYYQGVDNLVKAHGYFTKAIELFPKSLGGINSLISRSEIEQKTIQLEVENIQSPGKPILADLKYRNLDKARISLYKLSKEQTRQFEQFDNEYGKVIHRLNFLGKLEPYHRKEIQWKPIPDYKIHDFELSLDSFLPGHYVFLLEGGNLNDTTLKSYGSFDITQLAYTSRVLPTGEMEIRVMNRELGNPLEGVQVNLSRKIVKNQVESILYDSGNTNAEGLLLSRKMGDQSPNLQVSIHLSYKGNELNNEFENVQGTLENKDTSYEKKVLIFTDRQIYRPGQTLYFKALKYSYYRELSKLSVHDSLTITFSDANNKEISKISSMTNEFGTLSGKFLIPNNILPGRFTLDTDDGEIEVGVEEYKRPSFRLEVLPITRTYKLGDSVKIQGKINSYSGYGLSQSKIQYKITRSVNFWSTLYGTGGLRNGVYPSGATDEIAIGEVVSNNLGEFAISFKANPNFSDSKPYPDYNFNLEFVGTDGAGESQTLNSSLVVGNSDIQLIYSLPDRVFTQDTFNAPIKIQNLNHQDIQGKVQIKVWSIQTPGKDFIKRFWNKPDQFYLPKEEFKKDFPNYEFGEENNMNTWEKSPVPFEQNLALNAGGTGFLDLQSLRKQKPGIYKIQITGVNLQGDSISRFHYIRLLEFQGFLVDLSKGSSEISIVKPGEDMKIQLETLHPTYVLAEQMDGAKMISSKWYYMEPGVQILKFPISKSMKEPSIQFLSLFNNRLVSLKNQIYLIQQDTSLKVQMSSFRNKLEPGSKESWKIQIFNPKENHKINEVLAGLYDASLDALSPSSDWRNEIQWGNKEMSNYFYWTNQEISNSLNSRPFRYFYPEYNFLKKEYEQIDLMGYNYFGGYNYGNDDYWNKQKDRKAKYFNNLSKITRFEKAFKSEIKNPHTDFWIYGIIMDKGDKSPLAGASITYRNLTKSVFTDANGFFKIRVEGKVEIRIRYVGYVSQSFIIKKDQFLKVYLSGIVQRLNEVVTVGYGFAKRKALMGAVAKVSVRGLSSLYGSSAPGASSALEDRAAGLSLKFSPPVIAKDLEILKPTPQKEGNSQPSMAKPIAFRKNFNETAFFYPQLRTNERGEVKLEFTMPEALTEWKFRVLTHNQNMQWGYLETKVITQKQFSIEANMPRFLREGDTLKVSARLSNLSEKTLKGRVHLSLFNAVDMNPVNLFQNAQDSLQDFELAPKTNKPVSFSIIVPRGIDGISYRLSAEAGNYTDGEENTLPILPNRMLVMESLPMMIRSGQTMNYSLDKLLKNTSTTLENKSLTLEYTQNPAWYALLSMPYLMEFPYECSEQLFSRYFANSLATQLMNHNPLIKKVFDTWKEGGAKALESNLEKNPELKSTLLEETPWLREAGDESERKKRLSLLFDLNKMSAELKSNLDKLKERQLGNGGFTWFGGDYADRYITEHILAGIGQLEHLGIQSADQGDLNNIKNKALAYLDSELEKDYREYHSRKSAYDYVDMDLFSWYVRSFYPSRPLSPTLKIYFNEYLKRVELEGLKNSLYDQGLIAFTLLRNGKTEPAEKIIHSLVERSQDSPEMGMFWAENRSGYYWYQSPIETQALMIELFTEEGKHPKEVEELKIWLLRNKQTQNWSNTKATSEAIYALLLKQDSWLSDTTGSVIHMGDKSLSELKPDLKKEAGTGYFKTSWSGSEIHPELARVKIENQGKSISWGGLYWQYLENLDKITPSKTDIVLSRKYYIQKNSDRGPVLTEIDANHIPKVGDLLKVVVYLQSGRDYEYVQLKDMRPAGTEPVSTLSEYKYQDGLYYYQVTKDVATNFFISELGKGNFVFEYGLRVTQPGNYSTGISSIQCMYAPEFTAHSEGKRILFQP